MTDGPKHPGLIPPFDRVDDPIAAFAYNELFTSGGYKIYLGDSYPVEPDAPNPGFPPEPLELLSITGAYFHPLGGLAKGYISLSENLPSKRQALGLKEELKKAVQGHHREAASITAASFLPDVRVMQQVLRPGTKKGSA